MMMVMMMKMNYKTATEAEHSSNNDMCQKTRIMLSHAVNQKTFSLVYI